MPARGRPRAFDRDAALFCAMRVFWEQGYEGTSMAELTSAMGLNAPSVYAAFGSKAELFKAAVEAYSEHVGAEIWDALSKAETARQGFTDFLDQTALAYTRADQPHGCMIALGALHGGADIVPACGVLREKRLENIRLLHERLSQGIEDGDVPEGVDCRQIAEFYATVQHGMSIMARDGGSLEQLRRTAAAAMAAWDGLAGTQS